MAYIEHEETYKGYNIRIEQDEYAESPVDKWDFLGSFVCFHSRYSLGHENENDLELWLMRAIDPDVAARIEDKYNRFECPNKDLIDALMEQFGKENICLPVYMYDHGGITINTSGFSCSWDSGQIGFIYVPKEKIRKEYGVKRISPKLRKNVQEILKSEIKSVDDYLTGNVYGFRILDAQENDIDSCWGFYGDSEYCLQAARESADFYRAEYDRTIRARVYGIAADTAARVKMEAPFRFRPAVLA